MVNKARSAQKGVQGRLPLELKALLKTPLIFEKFEVFLKVEILLI